MSFRVEIKVDRERETNAVEKYAALATMQDLIDQILRL